MAMLKSQQLDNIKSKAYPKFEHGKLRYQNKEFVHFISLLGEKENTEIFRTVLHYGVIQYVCYPSFSLSPPESSYRPFGPYRKPISLQNWP